MPYNTKDVDSLVATAEALLAENEALRSKIAQFEQQKQATARVAAICAGQLVSRNVLSREKVAAWVDGVTADPAVVFSKYIPDLLGVADSRTLGPGAAEPRSKQASTEEETGVIPEPQFMLSSFGSPALREKMAQLSAQTYKI